MNYEEAIEYIHKIPKFRRPLGNANLKKLLELLGNPQNALQFIHIAGTNGKGSAAAMLDAVLRAQGIKTGLFTSPFIEIFNERIQTNGKMISNEELAECAEEVKNIMEESGAFVSEFAFITAAAFLYFKKCQCDYVILEAGMGGRLDATNVIDSSVVSVLMSIGLDHTQYLGNTAEEIAFEKCGIIKKNGAVVSYPNTHVKDVIQNAADNMNAEIIFAEHAEKSSGGFIYKNKEYPLNLKGSYQPDNAAVVLETIFMLQKKGIDISDEAILKGLGSVTWQARFEFVRENIIIDGGHNADGLRALRKSLEQIKKPVMIIIAMMEDKNYIDSVKEIAPAADMIITSEINMERCLGANALSEAFKNIGYKSRTEPDLEKALKTALEYDGTVCICGSLYLAGEAKRILNSL